MSTERVELLDLTRPLGEVREGTFLQRAGVKLFLWVLLSTIGTLAALFAFLLWQMLQVPAVTGLGSTVADSALVRIAVEQRADVFDDFIEGVEALVVGVFLPLLTAILGYIFGTSTGMSNGGEAEEG